MFRSKSSRETMRQKAKRTEKERLERIKNKEKNRKRPNTVAFRMSDEEKRLFEDRVTMSGLLKQDFIIQSLLFSDVQFRGSNIAIKRIEERLDAIEMNIKSVLKKEELDSVLMEELATIIELTQRKSL
ncbi:hypothetical protein HMPREF9628_02039 [Peptoanaerobacter stomatis]|uniref:Uncharacterized protein n=1 Tax=Peptoanaerobacter stomatis TaxID=796937 RepID=G9XEG9_9FIRM|nr:hypothetical protein [Peptoanaerobacter stomatis]EHL18652.1 hypothetical protein HMPREF9628_02039 [Peptoanaerobacter stomatis]